MESLTRPVLFGYQSVRLNAPEDALARGERSLKGYAEREGYSLGTIFVEQDPDRPLSALNALMDAARREGVKAVAVPTPLDLGQVARVRHLTRRKLQNEGQLRVLVVEPER